jgi:hydrogenase maturation protein HypF
MGSDKTFKIIITGIVQGVGFRPFIYNQALKKRLCGDVCNTSDGVIIRFNAPDIKAANEFANLIKNNKPEPAFIEDIEIKEIEYLPFTDFKIAASKSTSDGFVLVSPDLATCSNCLKDINNPKEKRRYNYAFTNCTNCGPRFTIIKKLPYDRASTTMSGFKMCAECSNEYLTPSDRRFHAQPDACCKCGPQLQVIDNSGNIQNTDDPIDFIVKQIKNGKIIGIKSLGGFQIACDATSDKTVSRLRKSKMRPFKPFAVMVKDIKTAKYFYKLSNSEEELLISPKAPIVLLKKKIFKENLNSNENLVLDKKFQYFDGMLKPIGLLAAKPVSHCVSFYNNFEGVMLPYTPIHHLIFKKIFFPLVMTSGNISEEPIVFENEEAVKKLSKICDYFLIHDRDIFSRFDDSLVKVYKKKEMLLRRARGYAPYPVKIDTELKNKTILAIGSEEKNTFCILKNNFALISQHIGDIDNPDSIDFFESTLNTFYSLFNIKKIDLCVSDLHPNFKLNQLPTGRIIPQKTIKVQHHKAHIASVIAENHIKGNVLGFAWDGTGFGDDGNIWGSEIFIVDENLNFRRIGHLSEKILPGNEISIKKPYRMAITYLYYSWIKENGFNSSRMDKSSITSKSFIEINKMADKKFIEYLKSNFPRLFKLSSKKEVLALLFQIKSGFNSSKTTSMGRLFDSISSILGLVDISSFEGEAAISLEMAIKKNTKNFYEFNYIKQPGNISKDDCFIIDDIDLFSRIIKDIFYCKKPDLISANFHNTLANIILDISIKTRNKFTIKNIALSGGVFQNNYLVDKTFRMLENNNFNVYTNYKVPVNDGGISLGQAYLGVKSINVF